MSHRTATPSSRSASSPRLELDQHPLVLLADDEHDIRALLAAALRREGYRVVEAATGAELLEQVSSSMLFGERPAPDLIVSDIRMPGFTGTGILSGLRASNWTTPFILITAYGTEDLFREARELGADAVFRKPFEIDDLLTAICNLVPHRVMARPWQQKTSPEAEVVEGEDRAPAPAAPDYD